MNSIPFDSGVTVNTAFPVTTLDDAEVSAADGLGSLGDAAGLSPDALMTYCQSRLDSIDGQVNDTFNQQESRNSETTAVQRATSTLQSYSAGVNGGDPQGSAKCAEIETAFQNAVDQIKGSDPSNPDLPKLIQTYNNLLWSGTGPKPDATPPLDYIDSDTYPPQPSGNQNDNILSTDEVQSFVQTLQGASTDLNSGAELQMIQLESLMSQRQTAVELTTNLVQSLGGQTEKIAENIGH